MDMDVGDVDIAEFPLLWAEHERQHARLATIASRIAARGSWAPDYVSAKAWLAMDCRMSRRDAGALLSLGRFLQRFDTVADAASTSALSTGQVQALRTMVSTETEELFDEQQAEIVDILKPLNVRQTETACQAWKERAEALVDRREPPIEPERSLILSRAADGALLAKMVFDRGFASLFEQALGTARVSNSDIADLPVSRRQADALFEIIAFFNANHDKPGTPRHRPHVEMVVDVDNVTGEHCNASTTSGEPVPSASAETFLCDAVITWVTRSGNTVLDYKRSTRSVPLNLFRAVALRDGGCRFPNCDRPVAWTDAHHITFWRHDGHTRLDNLLLLCNKHHHLIHQPGWQIKLLPDATVETTFPDKRTKTSTPHHRPTLPKPRPPGPKWVRQPAMRAPH